MLLPDATGFIDIETFVTYSEIIHADGRRKARPRLSETETPEVVDIKGTQKEQESYSSLPVIQHIWRSASALHLLPHYQAT